MIRGINLDGRVGLCAFNAVSIFLEDYRNFRISGDCGCYERIVWIQLLCDIPSIIGYGMYYIAIVRGQSEASISHPEGLPAQCSHKEA